jgi:NADP-dependent 3-hydroxy acid dehydrogenase YdfG
MKKRIWMIAGASNDHVAKIVRMARVAGDSVLVTGRDVLKLEALFGEDTADFHVFQMDAASEAQTDLAARTCFFHFGKIDLLVDGATLQFEENAEDYSEVEKVRYLQVNIAGGLNLLRATLPYMQSNGSIITCLPHPLLESYMARHTGIEFISEYQRIDEVFAGVT